MKTTYVYNDLILKNVFLNHCFIESSSYTCNINGRGTYEQNISNWYNEMTQSPCIYKTKLI